MNLKNAIVDNLRTMKDGSIKITLLTRELDPKQMAELFLSVNQEIMSIEIPEDSGGTKSPSQRLRDRLWAYYNNKNKNADKFNMFYADTLEMIGKRYLEKIEE